MGESGIPHVIQRKDKHYYHLIPDIEIGLTKHYYTNGRRIATRVDDELYYLLPDHPSTLLRTGLGSTTVVVDAQGNEACPERSRRVGHALYDPYGEMVEATLPEGLTDRLFTGQRWDDTIGLYDYNARFYDPQLGQLTQPDSLVAQPYNPIAWNRYAYVYDNPVNYTDSSGHFIDTLWDIVDLGVNAQNCLGDSDALACYMTPVAAAAVVAPFLTTGGFGDDAVKAVVRGGSGGGLPPGGGGGGLPPSGDEFVTFYHGTKGRRVSTFDEGGEIIPYGSEFRDHGVAFYTSPRQHEGIEWAERNADPYLIRIDIPKDLKTQLNVC